MRNKSRGCSNFKADSVILSIEQGLRSNIISNTIGINVNGVDLIEVDQTNFEERLEKACLHQEMW
ncbi:hypothetical protein [uncultured Clostridium sp.]|uniref:hypothetical protein n=1 Tax=uncultured Clostridium sp. TaxID=59620 RepID=UPI0028E59673|nr:hypothetical protein [uncultured Clostridium sp.]